MKIIGIILIIIGAINVITGFAGLTSNYADQAISSIGFGIGFIVLGAYLINRAKKKKEEKEEKDKWENE
ncbi:hypothetical protein P700755_002361 [Psychroflexus torquis ATCC 700755]|jgi:uncharacterized membrane protein YfcA|uniref:Uncharacterized protein n=1 Tax=Psychroflexus torquis (strain ATCC 700755 / CIP 106069 / ACAM 623) TaxID=313595 RepID=K4IH69_PSYTT|nr:hypothetical protein [Psychroflexus torquis]AFU69138.1 hypothetical protein P700755_002361 [Psychroflexus torquis ATCC 700755]